MSPGGARDYEIFVQRRDLIGYGAGHAHIVIFTGAAAESVEVSDSGYFLVQRSG